MCFWNKFIFCFPATCDFENDKCTWTNVNDDAYDWIVGEGNTPTQMTGPPFDHSKKNGDGMISNV